MCKFKNKIIARECKYASFSWILRTKKVLRLTVKIK